MRHKELSELLSLDLTKTQKEIIRTLNDQRIVINARFFAGLPKEAKELSVASISRARKYHLTNAVIDFAQSCRYYYANIQPNAAKYSRYNELCNQYQKIRRVEELIDARFAEFMIRINQRKFAKEIDERFIEEVKILLEREQNFYICLRSYVMLVSYYSMIGDNAAAITQCQSAIGYFKSIGFETKRTIESFSLISLPMMISAGQYDEAHSIIEEHRPKKKSLNYFKFQQCLVCCEFRSGNYQAAHELLFSTSLHGAPANFKDEWETMKAYAGWLVDIGVVQADKFRFGKFLNKVEKWTADKGGHNINLVILEVLFAFTRSSDVIYDRTPALRRYMLRHTKKGSRNWIFTSGLIKWVERNFVYDFSKEINLLTTTIPQSIDLEIIPYETLLQLITRKP